jgi:hypothetical protein
MDLQEQIINIAKAGAFDVVSKQVGELKESNKELVDIGSTILATMVLEKVERFDLVERLKAAILKATKPYNL